MVKTILCNTQNTLQVCLQRLIFWTIKITLGDDIITLEQNVHIGRVVTQNSQHWNIHPLIQSKTIIKSNWLKHLFSLTVMNIYTHCVTD